MDVPVNRSRITSPQTPRLFGLFLFVIHRKMEGAKMPPRRQGFNRFHVLEELSHSHSHTYVTSRVLISTLVVQVRVMSYVDANPQRISSSNNVIVVESSRSNSGGGLLLTVVVVVVHCSRSETNLYVSCWQPIYSVAREEAYSFEFFCFVAYPAERLRTVAASSVGGNERNEPPCITALSAVRGLQKSCWLKEEKYSQKRNKIKEKKRKEIERRDGEKSLNRDSPSTFYIR
ncbi:LOW QUALITY PROTEIN: hypothetical protein V1478_014711, partial [Vespula squamosa]